MRKLFGDTLMRDLKSLGKNEWICVVTEPLWGLSFNLIIPYAPVYMLALGLNDAEVGVVATVSMLSQVIFAFLSGPVTDKYGRRLTTLVCDLIAWCVPGIIWCFSVNFRWFFAAALINGIMQIVTNSWNCLLVEDAEKDKIAGIHSLVVIAIQLSSFFGPVIALMFAKMPLVTAMRVLYVNSTVLMAAKIVLCYVFSRETRTGIIRMEESRGKNLVTLALGYGGVVKIIGASRGTVFAVALTAIIGIVVMINNTFWQIIVSQKLLVPYQILPFFPVLKSAVTIVFLFFVAPRMTKGLLKLPLLAGYICHFAGQAVLVLAPAETALKYVLLCLSLIFDGFGYGILFMLSKALVTLNVNANERARAMAIVSMVVMAVTAPFGWIAGVLSTISRGLPFVLNLCLLALGFYLTVAFYAKTGKPREE